MAIILDDKTRSLTIVLSGAKTVNDCPFSASYEDAAPGASVRGTSVGTNPGKTNGVTVVTVVPAPPDGFQRKLKSFNLSNQDTAACTYLIKIADSDDANGPYTVTQITLQTLESLMYEEGFGFWTLDVNGAQKSQAAATSSATSTAQATASAASVSVSAASISISTVSSQASSLAGGIVIASVNSVSSQASSMAALTPASVSSQASSIAAAIVPASINSVSSQASSMNALGPASIASSLASVSALQSGASVQSFTSTNWSTVSSATSRVKSSFGW
ncbi:MAG TPA: hypothetical protein VF787_03245 [Thermoanaerobaculia bacterium]